MSYRGGLIGNSMTFAALLACVCVCVCVYVTCVTRLHKHLAVCLLGSSKRHI